MQSILVDDAELKNFYSYWNSGPSIKVLDDNAVSVTARYEDGSPARVRGKYGSGNVDSIAFHPEIDKHAFEETPENKSDRHLFLRSVFHNAGII